ncbi:MAG: hypothetical protein VX777_04495 [Chlamydiota bacterium]|nr:hypothetical protein [Chlamydiota bacterium]
MVYNINLTPSNIIDGNVYKVNSIICEINHSIVTRAISTPLTYISTQYFDNSVNIIGHSNDDKNGEIILMVSNIAYCNEKTIKNQITMALAALNNRAVHEINNSILKLNLLFSNLFKKNVPVLNPHLNCDAGIDISLSMNDDILDERLVSITKTALEPDRMYYDSILKIFIEFMKGKSISKKYSLEKSIIKELEKKIAPLQINEPPVEQSIKPNSPPFIPITQHQCLLPHIDSILPENANPFLAINTLPTSPTHQLPSIRTLFNFQSWSE